MAENPEMTAKEAMQVSEKMMAETNGDCSACNLASLAGRFFVSSVWESASCG